MADSNLLSGPSFTTLAVVTFDGPNIVAQSGVENVLFSFDENGQGNVASRFTGATTYQLAPTSDALPLGLTINSTTGNVEGTPVEVVTRNIIIEGTDEYGPELWTDPAGFIGSDWVYEGDGVYSINLAGGGTSVTNQGVVVTGKNYRLIVDLQEVAGNISARQDTTVLQALSTGTNVVDFTALAVPGDIQIRCTAAGTIATVFGVSLRELL